MNWKKIILRGAAIFGIFLVLIVFGGYFYLRSARFNQFALRKIVEKVNESTGGRAEIRAFDFQLSTLTAHFHNIVIRGKESPSNPPLLSVDDLTVGVKIRSVLGHQVYLSELLVGHPVIHLQIDPQGNSNIPVPDKQGKTSSSQTNVFDLGVRHASITNGEIVYNDHKTPLEADLHDLRTDVSFEYMARRYEGTIAYGSGSLHYANYQPLSHSFEAFFTATPSEFDLESALMRIASSTVKLTANVTNYTAPHVNGKYDLLIHTQDAKAIDPTINLAGDVSLAGKLHYQDRSGASFLRNVQLDGEIASESLAANLSGNRIELHSLRGGYRLADGSLHTDGLIADAFDGRIAANIDMNDLDGTPAAKVKADLRNISLAAVQHSMRQAKNQQIEVSGALTGSAEAAWSGSPSNALVRADFLIKNGSRRSSNQRSPNQRRILPVEGDFHLSYDGRSSVLKVAHSSLRVPSATITADGEISRQSRLIVHASAENLHDLVEFASSFRTGGAAPPAVAGSAMVDATIQGSTSQPTVSASLQARNLEIDGSQWKSAAFSLQAGPSHLTISDGSLLDTHKGQASFNASMTLHNWAYGPSNPVQVNLSVTRMLLADLQQAAGVHYPVNGVLSARISLNGSQIDPRGSGTVEVANARAYDEPLKNLKLAVQGQNGSISSQLNIASAAGSAVANLEYTPRTKAYKVSVDVPDMVLEKLRTIQEKNLALKGSVTLKASGQGTLDDPQLNASIQLPKLEIKEKSIAGVNAELQVAHKRADFSLDSEIAQAAVKARGRVDLTGDFQADASIDSTVIPLDVLLATYTNSAPEGFSGQAELHATLKGPLKKKSLLQAHVEVPKLSASYQALQVGIASPVKVDYANSVVTLQPAEFRGTGTSIRVQGSLPLAGPSAPNLSAEGTVDAKIARILAPTLRSSGTINLNVRATGSASEPQLEGEMRLQNIAVSTPASPLSVDKLNGILKLDNEKVRISEMKAEVGGGQVSIGGTFGYRDSKAFDLALQASSVRLRYPEGLRSVFDSNLTWAGDMDDSTLRGTLLIDGLSFTPDFDLASFGDQFSSNASVPAEPGFADTINLQVRVQSKDNLSATSSQVSLEGSAALNVTGTAANPVVTGRTDLTSGELFYRNVRYQLQRGLITFTDPNETKPNLDVSVTTTIEQYNLTLNLRGPFDRLTTSYSSDPPLATADVINLIARGKTSSELAASSQSTDSMIASQAASQVSGNVQKLVGISSLQIDPTIGGNNQNPSARIAVQQRVTRNFLFTFSTDVSQPGAEIVQGDYQINKRWSVSVARDQLGGVSVDGRFHTRF
jgi:translocation and assembly module TamB